MAEAPLYVKFLIYLFVLVYMCLLPFSRKTVVRLGVLIILPLLPLTLTMIPLDQMIDRAIKIFI